MEQSAFYQMTPESQKDQPWWRVATVFFQEHLQTEHQISSFNAFMREKLPNIITNSEFEYSKIDKDGKVNYRVTFENVYVKRPQFTEKNGVIKKLKPRDCRIRNLNYMCQVYTDIIRKIVDGEKVEKTETFPEIFIGEIPCMVLSNYCNLHGKDAAGMIKNGECPKDPGGYFIVGGSEKVLMSQDRMAHNEIFVFKSKDKDTIKIAVSGQDKNGSLPCGWSAEVRSHSIFCEPNITTTYIKLSEKQLDKGEDQRLYIEVPGFKAPVAWPIIFIAFGVTDQKEMARYVCDPTDTEMMNLLEPSLECPFKEDGNVQEQALEYLTNFILSDQKDSKKKMENVRKILTQKIFQNISSPSLKKAYLGQMTNQLLSTVLGRRSEDDRDHYSKKRVDTAGVLINNLFKSIWKRIIRETVNNLVKKRANDLKQLFFRRVNNYILPPFKTGNWSATKANNKPTKAGVSQILNRHNYVSTISNLRRVITPNDKNSKIIKPRHLHNSQWYYICPAETPEGQATGLIKNLAMLTSISLGSSEDSVLDWLRIFSQKGLCQMISGERHDNYGTTRIFLNGSWVGSTNFPEKVSLLLRKLRRSGKLEFDTSVSLTKEGIRLLTDEGRLIAPFFIVEKSSLKKLPEGEFKWKDLLSNGIVEYLDPSELETLKHSECPWDLSTNDSHALLHPCFLLGVSASTAPYSHCNQSPRNIYQASMGKQALGIFSTNFLQRFDTSSHILCYPQKPIVNTATMRLLGTDTVPSGQNLIVAVMSAAYNQEDSVVINQRAIDNGALRSINYSTYAESCHKKAGNRDDIRRPGGNVKEIRLKGYSKLDEDGLCKEDTPLAKRDIVIGKVHGCGDTFRDISVPIKTNGMEDDSVIEALEEDKEAYLVNHKGTAMVDRSFVTLNEDGFRTVKVCVRQMRIPQIGDKVASRSAQKGIIGMISPPENMPFSEKTGMVPDLLMNPNAIPSRMTMGQILECLIGKACALNGAYADCTPFEPNFNRGVVAEELARFGFDECGDEVVINGLTGERMTCKIFMGPTYYQRLKHMVDDKIHARDQDGSRETLTRQPVEGRKRGGGFKLGEMEVWCGISHGASLFLNDRLVNNSDGYEMYVCNYCGNVAIANPKINRYECKRCEQNIAISKIRIPYAFKLLMQELQSVGLGIWINVDETKMLVAAPTPSH